MNYYSNNLNVGNTKNTYQSNVGLKFYKTIHKLLALIVIAWLNNGTFTYIVPYFPNYLRWGVFFLWFGLVLLSNKKFGEKFILQCWPLLIFYFYIVLISLFVSEAYIDTYIKNLTYLIMVYSIFLYYFSVAGKYRAFQKLLVVFLLFDCAFLSINTYLQLQINPLLARYLSASSDTAENLLGTSVIHGVGSYAFFYSLVAIILLLGYMFLINCKRKLLILLSIFSFSVVLIKASFTIAILFTFGFLAIMIVMKYTKKHRYIILFLLSGMLLFFSQGGLVWTLSQLATINGISSEISTRLNEMSAFLSGENLSGSDISARADRYSRSIDVIVNNPILGSSVSAGAPTGGHSEWLDLFARFGLFSVLFFIFLFKAYKYCKSRVSEKFKVFVNIYWLYFICLGFVNTLLVANIFTIWFLFLPVFINFLEQKPLIEEAI